MTKRFWVAALSFAFVSIQASAAAAFVLEPYKTEYDVHANGIKVGEMTRELSPAKDGSWVLQSDIYTTGLVSVFKKDHLRERSVWRRQDQQLVPLDYVYRYRGRNKDVTERLQFDWRTHEVSSLRNGKHKRLPINVGVLDKLIYQIALRRDLAEGKRRLEYTLADRGRLKTYVFDVVGEEEVVTSLGTFRALKVKRETTTLWVAPELDYLVVQLVHEEDDYTLSSYITEISR